MDKRSRQTTRNGYAFRVSLGVHLPAHLSTDDREKLSQPRPAGFHFQRFAGRPVLHASHGVIKGSHDERRISFRHLKIALLHRFIHRAFGCRYKTGPHKHAGSPVAHGGSESPCIRNTTGGDNGN